MYRKVREGTFRMFLPYVLFHLMLAGVSTVSVAWNSLPVLSYVNMKQVTVLALAAEASVRCDTTDCDEDYIHPDNKRQRELTKTSPLKYSANEVDARQGNPAALKELGLGDSKTALKYSDFPRNSNFKAAVNVDDSTEDGKTEELTQTVNVPETSPSVTPHDRRVPNVHTRERRSVRNVALFRRAFKNIGLKGRVLYTAKKVTQLKFQFDSAQLRDVSSDDVMLADLRLYQRSQRRRQQHGRRRRHRVVTVRVSIHQIISSNRRFPRAKLIDTSLLHIGKRGWVNFNVTAAVKDWMSSSQTNKGLQVWAESVKGGNKAARAVRKLKFVATGSKKPKAKSPAVVLYLRTVK